MMGYESFNNSAATLALGKDSSHIKNKLVSHCCRVCLFSTCMSEVEMYHVVSLLCELYKPAGQGSIDSVLSGIKYICSLLCVCCLSASVCDCSGSVRHWSTEASCNVPGKV